MGTPVPESDLPSRVVPTDDLPSAAPKSAPTKPPSLLSRAVRPIAELPGAVGSEFEAGASQIGGAEKSYAEAAAKGETPPMSASAQMAMGAIQEMFSPITGSAKALVGDPVRRITRGATGSDIASRLVGGTAEDVASFVGPGVVGKSLSRVADAMPAFSKSVQKLIDEGVQLTPGMIYQSAVKNVEDFLQKMPLAGSLVKNGQRAALESFNRVVINKALEPIGERLPKDMAAGRDSIRFAGDKIGGEYDKLLPKLTFQITPEFNADVSNIVQKAAARLPEGQWKQLSAIGQDIIMDRLDPSGAMPGRAYKDVESELNFLGRQYLKANDPAQKMLGSAISEMRAAMLKNLERTNPMYSDRLKELNSAWAAFTRARDASIRRASSGGIFSPNDLLQAVKSGGSKTAFASGDALFQDIAEAANEVLPKNVPEGLGLVGQGTLTGLLGGGLALKPPVAAAGAAMTLPYTKPGMAAINKFARRTTGATPELIRSSAPVAATAAEQGQE